MALPDFSLAQLLEWLHRYESLGPLPGIGLTFIEAFLPVLPLFAIVTGNAAAYGLWAGFLYSWIGVCTGALCVFLIFRKLGRGRFLTFVARHEKVERGMKWMNRHGFSAVFLLSCFPFSPSSVVNIVAGLSNIPIRQFAAAILLGKAVMIFMLSFIGHDITAFIQDPWKLLLAVGAIVLLWYVGKLAEARIISAKHNKQT